MKVTADYQLENEEMQHRQWAQKNGQWQKKADAGRFAQINKIKGDAKTVLSIGCGPKEPIGIGATHACDIAFNAQRFLEGSQWKGEFKQCSCDDLPYADKQFDFVVCSEVIEHLPEEADIMRTFQEVDRVGKRWLLTTPWITRKQGNTEKTHRHFLNEEEIKRIVPDIPMKMERFDIFLFMTGGKDG